MWVSHKTMKFIARGSNPYHSTYVFLEDSNLPLPFSTQEQKMGTQYEEMNAYLIMIDALSWQLWFSPKTWVIIRLNYPQGEHNEYLWGFPW